MSILHGGVFAASTFRMVSRNRKGFSRLLRRQLGNRNHHVSIDAQLGRNQRIGTQLPKRTVDIGVERTGQRKRVRLVVHIVWTGLP